MGSLHGKQRWRNIARHQLRIQPLCQMCLAKGIVTPATVADHIQPHRGDSRKFWFGALQSLCDSHHNRDKKRLERDGFDRAVGPDGLPLDKNHPIYR